MLFYDPAKSDPSICKNIRCKMSYVPGSSEEYPSELSTTAQHWCIHTMNPVGKDGNFVTPHECDAERECFESPE